MNTESKQLKDLARSSGIDLEILKKYYYIVEAYGCSASIARGLVDIVEVAVPFKELVIGCSNYPIAALAYLTKFPDCKELESLEETIARSSETSYVYAIKNLKNRFPKGEPSIIKDPLLSGLYLTYLKSIGND